MEFYMCNFFGGPYEENDNNYPLDVRLHLLL